MENGSIYFSEEFENCLTMYIHERKYEQRTAAEYTGAIRVLCAYTKKDFLDITASDADDFFKHMNIRIQNNDLSATTYNVRLSCYKNLASYIASNYPEYCFVNPFISISSLPYNAHIKASNIPSLEDIDTLLNTCSNYPMYYLIFSLAFRVSLSSSDIVALRRSYIQETAENMVIVFPADKVHKDSRVVQLPEDVGVLLKKYIKTVMYYDADQHLFYNKYRNPLTLRNLDSIVKKMIRKSGLPENYRLKDFRSRAILDMVRASADDDIALEKISEYADIGQLRLGHYLDARYLADDCPGNYANIRVKAIE